MPGGCRAPRRLLARVLRGAAMVIAAGGYPADEAERAAGRAADHRRAAGRRPERFPPLDTGLGVRWFHTGGIFAGLAPNTSEVVVEALDSPRTPHGTIVSYDLNYRPRLWKGQGGKEGRARSTAGSPGYVDVMIGNEEDFTACLGLEVEEPTRT